MNSKQTDLNSETEHQSPNPPVTVEEPHTEAPVAEATFSKEPEQVSTVLPPSVKPRRQWLRMRNIFIAAVVLVVCLTNYGSYLYGYHRGSAKVNSAVASADATAANLQVPKGATIIEQCAVGRGTQYVLPSNIPHGPVFNVHNGKVIGLEYMIGKDDLASNKSFYDLPLYGKKYNHLNIGLLSEGHSGYSAPHYHVDLYTISRAASEAITCK